MYDYDFGPYMSLALGSIQISRAVDIVSWYLLHV
jgi:hypothetical protein